MGSITLRPVEVSGNVRDVPNLPLRARQVCAGTAELYAKVGFHPPWIGFLAFRGDECVGTCAFKSPPVDGAVEIAYYTFPEFEGHGVATHMVRLLLEVTAAFDPRVAIRAQTLPERNASNSILSNFGFALMGTVSHPDDGPVWEWRKEPAMPHDPSQTTH